MNRLLALIPAAILSSAALAQDAPEGAYQQLWCGIAFSSVAGSAPFSADDVASARAAGDAATPQQQEIIAFDDMATELTANGVTLVDAASAAYLEAGFTAEAFAGIRADLEPGIAEAIAGPGDDAEFSFEDCIALVPSPENATN